VIARVHEQAEDVRALRMTYEPEHLRFFQARFAPLARVPQPVVREVERV
jgi:tryptophanase